MVATGLQDPGLAERRNAAEVVLKEEKMAVQVCLYPSGQSGASDCRTRGVRAEPYRHTVSMTLFGGRSIVHGL